MESDRVSEIDLIGEKFERDTLVVMCTCPDQTCAERLAMLLVEKKLAACVNILPEIRSVYRWQEKVETSSEVLLIIKTVSRRYPALELLLLSEHPYEVPELIGLPIKTGSSTYLKWVDESLG